MRPQLTARRERRPLTPSQPAPSRVVTFMTLSANVFSVRVDQNEISASQHGFTFIFKHI